MALLESLPIPLGSLLPHFTLDDPDGVTFDTQEFFSDPRHKGLIVAFTCNHCPYAQAVWPRLVLLAHYARAKDIGTVAVNPNIHPDYPEDSPPEMKKLIKKLFIDFPYLIDKTQETARAFRAQCTPDLYFYGSDQKLVYHGRLDDNWKDPDQVRRHEFKEALDAYTAGEPVSKEQRPSLGCSIKWCH